MRQMQGAGRDEIELGEFMRLWEQERQTVLFVTHDIAEAITLSDRILLMSPGPGQIQAEYEVPLERPRNVDTVMESPVFRGLFKEIWAAEKVNLPLSKDVRDSVEAHASKIPIYTDL